MVAHRGSIFRDTGWDGDQHPPRMKTHMLLMSCLAGLLLAPVTLNAAESPLAVQMETVGSAFKALRTEQDPAKGAATAREAQDAVLKAAAIQPATITKLADAAAKAQATAEYRLMLGKLFVTLCEVEQAFLAKDMAKVATLLEDLKAHKKAGHTRFMEEE